MNLDELNRLVIKSLDPGGVGVTDLKSTIGRGGGAFAKIISRQKWIIWIFLAVSIIFIPQVLIHKKDELIFVLLYFILSVESLIALISLLQIRSLEKSGGNVKYNLLHRIRNLQSIFRSYIFLNCFLYLLLAVLLEYSMGHHWNSIFEGFSKLPALMRTFIYLLFISIQYFIKLRSFQKNYGWYLNNMIRILDQTKEN
jgi:hypothetical protein